MSTSSQLLSSLHALSSTSPSAEQHVVQIPQAVDIAASQDPTIPHELKSQAVEYLNKVRVLGEETWKACLALYLQGCGAGSSNVDGSGSGSASGSTGFDGKARMGSQLRVFCLQVVDDVLANKPSAINPEDLRTLYQVMVSYVHLEFVMGSAEDGVSFMRNKVAYTLTLVFLRLYPDSVPEFLQPFLSFLEVGAEGALSQSQSQSLSNGQSQDQQSQSSQQPQSQSRTQAMLLTLHLLVEIAAEIHDPLLKSSRAYTAERNNRDGMVRDGLRNSGDAKAVIDRLLGIVHRGLSLGGSASNETGIGAGPGMEEAVDWSLKALAAWAPWVDITVSITPNSLELYKQLVTRSAASPNASASPSSPSSSSNLKHSNAALSIYATLLSKGTKTSAEKLQIIQVLDVMSFVIPMEEHSRLSRAGYDRTNEEEQQRKNLARVLSAQGVESFKIAEDENADPSHRATAEALFYETLPVMLRFLEDTHDEVSLCVAPLLTDIMRMYKKNKKANESQFRLPPDKAQFFATLLETQVKKLQWPEGVAWTLSGEDEEDETDQEELEAFLDMRKRLRSDIDSIAYIDPDLFNSIVIGYISDTLNAYQSQGSAAVPWQRAELAVYLIFIYGETQKVGMGKEAFFNVPQDIQIQLREKSRERAEAFKTMKQKAVNGQPMDGSEGFKNYPQIDYSTLPLTAQGEILLKGIQSQILTYPHSAVTLQFLECCARYYEFFKCRRELIQPVLEAFVDARGIHNPKASVRHRVFYLFAKFVKDARNSIDSSFVLAILNSISDALPIQAVLPETDNPDEDLLVKATTGPQPFDNHLYVFEAVGSLVALVKVDTEQVSFLQAVMNPLVTGIQETLQRMAASSVTPLDVLQCHHLILAIGALAKGFPDAPEHIYEGSPAPLWHASFQQGIEAIIKALDYLKGYTCIRDAARLSFSGIIAALGVKVIQYIPLLVVHMVGEFDGRELVEFFGFLGMLSHKLKSAISSIMEELLPLLLQRTYIFLGATPTGTDDAIMLSEVKKSYTTFCSTLLTEGLQDILISERNKPQFEPWLHSVLSLVQDDSDKARQKGAILVINRTIPVWASDPAATHGPSIFLNDAAARNGVGKKADSTSTNGSSTPVASQALVGYEQIVYSQVVPAFFETIMKPEFSLRDGQSQLVSSL